MLSENTFVGGRAMAMTKKKAGVSANAASPSNLKQLATPRPKGIPTRIHKQYDREFDDNRNIRPGLSIEIVSSESRSTETGSNHSLDKADNRTRSLLPSTCRSGLNNSVPLSLKASPVKHPAECNNRSRTSHFSTYPSDHDTSQPMMNRVKASVSSMSSTSRPGSAAKLTVEPVPASACRSDVVQSLCCVKHPKRQLANRTSLGKNANKISSSNEACVVQSVNMNLCSDGKNTISRKEISHSAGHLPVRDVHRSGNGGELLNKSEDFSSDTSFTSNHATDKSSVNKSPSQRTDEAGPIGEAKRPPRGRPGTTENGPRTFLRPKSFGPSSASRVNLRIRQSSSNERTTVCKDSISQNTDKQSMSEAIPPDSSDVDQDGTRRRKSSGYSGSKVLPLKEQNGKTKYQHSLVLSKTGKNDRNLKNHVMYRNSFVTSKKDEQLKRDSGAKFPSIPKIHVSREPENKVAGSMPEMNGLVGKHEVMVPQRCVTKATGDESSSSQNNLAEIANGDVTKATGDETSSSLNNFPEIANGDVTKATGDETSSSLNNDPKNASGDG